MNNKKQAKTKSKKQANKTLGIVLLAVSFILAAVALYLYNDYNARMMTEQEKQSIINTGTFHNGIIINGVSVGSMTIDEAKLTLLPVLEETKNEIAITLKYDDYVQILTADDLGIAFNTDEVLNKAIMEAREGELDDIKKQIADIEQNGREFTVDYLPDKTALRKIIQSIAQELYSPPVDASFEINPEIMTKGTDLKAENLSGIDRFVFHEAEEGISVDEEKLLNEIESHISARDFNEISIPVINAPAAVTADSLKKSIVLRDSFHTSFGSGSYDRKERVFNITKAAGIINGTVVAPGEIFSMNEVLGDRTYSSGWQPAPAVVEGGAKTEDQPGGGVCQVSTTLYNAVVSSDLEVVYRQAHSMKLGYVDGGLDATIDSGHIDFKWRNNTKSDIYVFAWVDTEKKEVHCEIYGPPFPEEFDRIEFTSKRVSTIEPSADVYQYDESVPYGTIMLLNEARNGSVWKSYAAYYKGDTEIKTVEIAKTTYRAHPNRYAYGPGYIRPSGGPSNSKGPKKG